MLSVTRYLEDIELRLVPDQEGRILNQWKQFAKGEWKERYFCPTRTEIVETDAVWPDININDAIEDDDLMVISQFAGVSRALKSGDGGLLSVRPNFGVGILPSLFGTELFIMPREMNTLPNVRHIEGGAEAMEEIAGAPVPDLSSGHGEAVFRVGKIFEQIYREYPNIAAYVRTDHPDCQGPMDICELLWGSDIFLALFDRTDLVHELLSKVSDTYEQFLDAWFAISPAKDELHAFFGNAHLGKICVRDDSAMNLSPDMYTEFIMPYNSRVLDHFGGGAIHSCGRVDHFVPVLKEMNSLHGFNMSQPEYNDMETVYRNTIDVGIPVIGLARETTLSAERDLRGLVSTTAAQIPLWSGIP